jgi:glutamyl/glutaminyl-tRNA synthetase
LVARETSGAVVLRIEDHDRQRCRPEFELALLEDLEALGFEPTEPSIAELRSRARSDYRQSDSHALYAVVAEGLARRGLVYACDCSRTTFAAWSTQHGRPWSGPGCPGGCAARRLDRTAANLPWRLALGDGDEGWDDLILGPQSGVVAIAGDMAIRDRNGNWTYGFCVVADDLRHRIDLVIRGDDLLDATAGQIRLARLLERSEPPRFLHHPLVRHPGGRKLSKADGATAVRALLAAGSTALEVRREAAAEIGAPRSAALAGLESREYPRPKPRQPSRPAR